MTSELGKASTRIEEDGTHLLGGVRRVHANQLLIYNLPYLVFGRSVLHIRQGAATAHSMIQENTKLRTVTNRSAQKQKREDIAIKQREKGPSQALPLCQVEKRRKNTAHSRGVL